MSTSHDFIDTPPLDDDEFEEDFVYEDDKDESTSGREPIEEPLFSWLLRQAVYQTAPDDQVLHDYVTHVAPKLSELLALKTAKGGRKFIAERRAEGKTDDELERYKYDQSLRLDFIHFKWCNT